MGDNIIETNKNTYKFKNRDGEYILSIENSKMIWNEIETIDSNNTDKDIEEWAWEEISEREQGK